MDVGEMFWNNDVYHLWGHAIRFGKNSLRCRACKKEIEIPGKLRNSYYTPIYRMYLFKEFKNNSCDDVFQIGEGEYRRVNGATDEWVSIDEPSTGVLNISDVLRREGMGTSL